jgi:hypothetical protein
MTCISLNGLFWSFEISVVLTTLPTQVNFAEVVIHEIRFAPRVPWADPDASRRRESQMNLNRNRHSKPGFAAEAALDASWPSITIYPASTRQSK